MIASSQDTASLKAHIGAVRTFVQGSCSLLDCPFERGGTVCSQRTVDLRMAP